MTFKPMSTADLEADGPIKTLLYAHHGFGKTTQAVHYKRRYGPGFVISGEAGLRSIMHEKIDYLPFSSWDGPHDPANGIYSFKGICQIINGPEFRHAGYKWIMLDSLTEASDRLLEELEEKHRGSKNGFQLWQEYASQMLGACKWVRDLPYHVLVTALAKEENDDNGGTDYWPMVKGNAVGKQLPGIFDNVLCGVRVTSGDRTTPKVDRYVITDEVRGWHGKVRDPRRRLKPVERFGDHVDITELFERMSMPDSEHEKYLKAIQAAAAATKTSAA
jgi:hypothetical protein